MSPDSSSPIAAEPTEARYEVERKLGEGGAGAVYLVRDRDTGERLALKKLFRVDAKTVLRLKREFRSLQAVNHPHIIKLYDMGQGGDSWFLTMEYLDGRDLTSYLAGEPYSTANIGRAASTIECAPYSPRLVPAFAQLARGIHALHEAGMLHRDLKPSNVLVVNHRVVVLDFGLVRELSETAFRLTEDGGMAGTPAYMAPEQIAAKELTAATDWYAFGAMLYEAVSGFLPLEGSIVELLQAKLACDPQPLGSIAPSTPRWLSELCTALLRRDPRHRPSGAEVLALFDAAQPQAVPLTQTETLLPTETEAQAVSHPLVGRTAETKRLWEALREAEAGRAAVVHVRGASGTGKSALVEDFLAQVENEEGRGSGALVLRSRCYELEAMPFKALDGVIDALVQHLSPLDDFEVGHLLPVDVLALVRVFPVLERLNAVKRLLSVQKVAHDALQSRRQAETALRVLVENLAARAPVVLFIDDLHWGDMDSARVLKTWLAQPSAAPILFVFSYRSDEIATSTCLRSLLEEREQGGVEAAEYKIDVAPLASAEMRALCEQRFSARTAARAELVERVVQEAQGSPFLASQLVALAEAKSARGDSDVHALSLDLMIAQTSAMLAEDAKKVLALLAVAGRPMSPKVALKAAGVKRGGRAILHDLRGLNLVRTRDISGERMLEVYHDGVRERVQRSLSAIESQLLHGSLFETLERSGQSEPDWLHTLALGAGDDARALHYGNAAAERANASLAFERAAGLYRKCIELVAADAAGDLWSKLSLALARCGRGVEAAGACLEAAKYARADHATAWTQRAASHFLRSGHFAQGEALLRQVLVAKKIYVPSSDAGLAAAIAWERARVRLLGTKDSLRSPAETPRELIERFDLLSALYLNNQAYDPLRSGLFHTRALRAALEAGEPRRLARALCSASVVAALYGSEDAAHEADSFLARAAAINARFAESDHKPVHVARAIGAFWLGRMQEVMDASSEVERLFRVDAQDDPAGNYFSRFGVASVRLGALHFFGEYEQFASGLHRLLDEAAASDNRSALLSLTRSQTLLEQIEGRAPKSRARLHAQRGELPVNSFGTLHLLHMLAEMSDACAIGEYGAEGEYLDSAWARFLRSPVRRSAFVGFIAHSQHAHFALNRYIAEGRNGPPARAVRDDIHALEKLRLLAASAAAHRIRARVAFLSGQSEAAGARLRTSAAAYREAGMSHEVARDQFALGVIVQSDKGAVLRTQAQELIADLGVTDVLGDLCAHYPELVQPG